MDNFALIFIVVTALGLLAFWKIGRFVFKMVKNAQPEKDSSAKFNDGETKLAGQFDDIVKSLEKKGKSFILGPKDFSSVLFSHLVLPYMWVDVINCYSKPF